ncbi:MAG: hypothetical protein KKC68_06765 [Candidatus Thermoplasmatota archaeon]|nr:hypothetical protein [Candidatus Thermoplasmatota archaeon]MBU1941462.1 hypothetical protein [Candidatus Thermoplasmatota archaeon]
MIIKTLTLILTLNILLISLTAPLPAQQKKTILKTIENSPLNTDFDPLIDLNLTITITTIRTFDKIDLLTKPDLHVTLTLNNHTYTSNIWNNTTVVNTTWQITTDIPDTEDLYAITISLWDWNPFAPKQLDIGPTTNTKDTGRSLHIIYDIKTGRWYGDDNILGDPSGYGRANGCDDGSYTKNEYDAELFFTITQSDYDNDTLPYWTEENVYHTNPQENDADTDFDNDSIPTWWEHHWNYNPSLYDNHKQLDPDSDSLTNYEEYLVTDWGTDPYRPDLFLELDFMEDGPNGEQSTMSNSVVEQLKTPMHRRNIVYHIDVGQQEGGELIPFDNLTNISELQDIYQNFFIHNESNQWRRGIFYYGFFVYLCQLNGFAFQGDGPFLWGYGKGTNAFIIASKNMYRLANKTKKSVDYIYAASIMHEMGHNFGIRFSHPFRCDNRNTRYPWRLSFWLFKNYKSIMNYRYTYYTFDYSDGKHGRGDFNDWESIDLTYFEPIPPKERIISNIISI